MATRKEIRAQNLQNSKSILGDAEITADMTVRIYSKSRGKGEAQFIKKRESLTFRNRDEADRCIGDMVDAGVRIRKVEIVSVSGELLATLKPAKIRLTLTDEQKLARRAERQAAKAEKRGSRKKIAEAV
jgi:hypothetical protein